MSRMGRKRSAARGLEGRFVIGFGRDFWNELGVKYLILLTEHDHGASQYPRQRVVHQEQTVVPSEVAAAQQAEGCRAATKSVLDADSRPVCVSPTRAFGRGWSVAMVVSSASARPKTSGESCLPQMTIRQALRQVGHTSRHDRPGCLSARASSPPLTAWPSANARLGGQPRQTHARNR
jgi:hypothetical protein